MIRRDEGISIGTFRKRLMTRIIDLDAAAAKAHLEKANCYFRSDFPPYISFDAVLKDVAAAIW